MKKPRSRSSARSPGTGGARSIAPASRLARAPGQRSAPARGGVARPRSLQTPQARRLTGPDAPQRKARHWDFGRARAHPHGDALPETPPRIRAAPARKGRKPERAAHSSGEAARRRGGDDARNTPARRPSTRPFVGERVAQPDGEVPRRRGGDDPRNERGRRPSTRAFPVERPAGAGAGHARRVSTEPTDSGATLKLQKVLAQAGFGSRRDMELLI